MTAFRYSDGSSMVDQLILIALTRFPNSLCSVTTQRHGDLNVDLAPDLLGQIQEAFISYEHPLARLSSVRFDHYRFFSLICSCTSCFLT